MKDERDESEPTAAILTCVDKLTHLPAKLRRWLVAHQPTGALQYVADAQRIDLRLYLVDLPAETRCETLGVEHGVGVPVEEDKDVPREERPHVRLNELYDSGPEDPFEVIQRFGFPSSLSLSRPNGAARNAFTPIVGILA